MSTAGPNSPGTVVNDTAAGTVAWSNPSNATSSNNSYAETGTLFAASTTNYLKATNFGFSIPSGATINGITVDVEMMIKFAGADIRDQAVRIVKGGTIGSTDKSRAGVDWPASDAYITYGSSSDLWGESWTDSDINSSTFGFAIRGIYIGAKTAVGQIDHIRITVTYTAGGNTYSQTASGGAIGGGIAVHTKLITGSQTYTSGSGTWTVPDGVTSVNVYVIGGGAGGSNSASYGGGGGGCAYSPSFSVTPGASLAYSVGAGGSATVAGGNSTFSTLTGGGGGIPSSQLQNGGTASGGAFNYTGGNGNSGGFGWGGGGGSSAGTTSNGNIGDTGGSGGAGGVAVTNGGAGGTGKSSGNNGDPGSAPGGGGGSGGAGATGGSGGAGYIKLAWSAVYVNTYSNTASGGSLVAGTTVVKTLSFKTATGGGVAGGAYGRTDGGGGPSVAVCSARGAGVPAGQLSQTSISSSGDDGFWTYSFFFTTGSVKFGSIPPVV